MKTDTVEWGPIDDNLLDKLDAAIESYSGSGHAGLEDIARVLNQLRTECEAVVVDGLWHDVVVRREVVERSVDWDDFTAPIYLSAGPWTFHLDATTEPHARMIQTTVRR